MTSLEDQQALLLYRVGPVLCCAPSMSVLSIIQPVPLTHPPGHDPARPGIFRHGGQVIKTEELRVRFGVDEADRKPGRLIIAEVDSGPTAFWVDEIIDVIQMPTSGWGNLPAQLPRGIFSRTLLLNDSIYLYAEFDVLHKLQGHGLLKTYIETLLADSTPTPEDTQATVPATPVSTTSPREAISQPNSDTEKEIPDEPAHAAADPLQPVPDEQPEEKPDLHIPTVPPQPDRSIPERPASTRARQSTATTRATTSSPLSKQTPNHTRETIVSGAVHSRPIPPRPEQTYRDTMARQPDVTENKLNASPPLGPAAKQQGFPIIGALLTLLLLGAAAGGTYYYLQYPSTATLVSLEDISSSVTSSPPILESVSKPPPVANAEVPPTGPAMAATPAIDKNDQSATTPTNVSATPTTPSTEVMAPYQAKIEHDEEGITIVIKAPKEESVLKSVTTETKAHQDSDTTNTPTAIEQPSHEKTPSVRPSAPQREEILHIVVKGDTLWDIAKRYVNNPFLYPELARLSNIKNPDLIYPGDRVRIIREFN